MHLHLHLQPQSATAPATRYFYSKNSGLQNQSVIYVQDSLKDSPRVLLDPNTFSEDGTVSLSSSSWSHDGGVLAYGTSKSGIRL